MLKDLEDSFYRILPAPRADLIVKAINELESVNFENGVAEVYQLWSGSPISDTAQMIDDTEVILRTAHRMLLHRYGISLSEESLASLVETNERIRYIGTSMEHEMYREVLLKENDAIDTTAELLAMPFGENWTKHSTKLAVVSEDFIQRVKDIHDVDPDEEAVVPMDVSLLRKYVRRFPRRVAENMVRDLGMPPGTPVEATVSQYKSYLKGLCPDNPKDAAIEFLGMVILSGEGYDQLSRTTADELAKFYTDPEFLLKLPNQISMALNEIPRNG